VRFSIFVEGAAREPEIVADPAHEGLVIALGRERARRGAQDARAGPVAQRFRFVELRLKLVEIARRRDRLRRGLPASRRGRAPCFPHALTPLRAAPKVTRVSLFGDVEE